MTQLIIAVGIPGSGKSTYAEQWLARGGQMIGLLLISTDQTRKELTGSEEDMSQDEEVFDLVYRRVKVALHQGFTVYVDATNLRPEYRKQLFNMGIARRDGLNPPCVALRFTDSTDFQLCQDRNVRRGRVVPYRVMERFHTLFLRYCTVEQLENEGWKVEEVGIR